MSRCGKTHLLEAAVLSETPDDGLRAHAAQCPRCRHELNWLQAEQRLFRERAAREEVRGLWKGVAHRTGVEPQPHRVSRALVGLAAAVLLVLGAGRLLVAPASSGGLDASVAAREEAFEALMTENAISQERAELCSRFEQGIGFHCGYVPASLVASR